MNAYRTRLAVLGFEGRESPSTGLPADPPPADVGYNDGVLILRASAEGTGDGAADADLYTRFGSRPTTR
jgi:hypothetical protein